MPPGAGRAPGMCPGLIRVPRRMVSLRDGSWRRQKRSRKRTFPDVPVTLYGGGGTTEARDGAAIVTRRAGAYWHDS